MTTTLLHRRAYVCTDLHSLTLWCKLIHMTAYTETVTALTNARNSVLADLRTAQAAVNHADELRKSAADARREAVTAARDLGLSFANIAGELGITISGVAAIAKGGGTVEP